MFTPLENFISNFQTQADGLCDQFHIPALKKAEKISIEKLESMTNPIAQQLYLLHNLCVNSLTCLSTDETEKKAAGESLRNHFGKFLSNSTKRHKFLLKRDHPGLTFPVRMSMMSLLTFLLENMQKIYDGKKTPIGLINKDEFHNGIKSIINIILPGVEGFKKKVAVKALCSQWVMRHALDEAVKEFHDEEAKINKLKDDESQIPYGASSFDERGTSPTTPTASLQDRDTSPTIPAASPGDSISSPSNGSDGKVTGLSLMPTLPSIALFGPEGKQTAEHLAEVFSPTVG
jgi:hypothetical protein